MRTDLIHFTDCNTSKLSFLTQQSNGSTNAETRSNMKKILSKAILSELTDRQRVCVVEHYLNNRKEKDIALELGINASTVSRHLKVARKKLRNIASYYM